MKAETTALLLSLFAISAHADTLLFSRTDLSLWECNSRAPQSATYVGVGTMVGTHQPSYDGSLWWIDPKTDSLIRDGTPVGVLYWYDDKVWDAQPIHGFTISYDGNAWLASQDSEDSPTSFLLDLDLNTGRVEPVGPLGDGPSIVNGISVVPEPSTSTMLLVGLSFICLYRMASRQRQFTTPGQQQRKEEIH